jgi:hypothetical protein
MAPGVFAAAEESNSLAAWSSDMGDAWCRGEESDEPYVIAMVMHHLPPESGLLRTELLVIVGIMRTRLGIHKEPELMRRYLTPNCLTFSYSKWKLTVSTLSCSTRLCS